MNVRDFSNEQALELAPGAGHYRSFVGPAYRYDLLGGSQFSLLFLLGPTFLNYFYLSSCVTLVQEEVRPEQRVMSGALLLLVMNLIGLGLGPTFVGAASDWFRASHPDNSLQMALYTLVPFYFIAIGLFLWLARVLGRGTQSPSAGGANA